MSTWFYQGKAEPVFTGAAPEAVTVDRFAPAYPQPSRPLMRAGAVAALLFSTPVAAPVSTSAEVATADRPVATCPQPSRVVARAAGTSAAAPVSTAAEATTADRWAPTLVQPDRRPSHAAGTIVLVQLVVAPATTTADRHQPAFPQPDRTTRYAPGTRDVVPVSTLAEATTLDRWLPAFVQAERTRRYAPGSTVVPVVGSPEATTPDRWLPTLVQPRRDVRLATGTSSSAPVYVAPPAPLPDFGWFAVQSQPDRHPFHLARLVAPSALVVVDFGPPPHVAADLLEAVVTYLKAQASVTGLLSDPDAILLDLSNWGTEMPFLLVENYDEMLPGDSTEDEPVELTLCVYAGTIPLVRALLDAVCDAVDSPNINPNSTRTDQFAFEGGASTGIMRNRKRVAREPMLVRHGELAYEGRVDYEVYVTPNQ